MQLQDSLSFTDRWVISFMYLSTQPCGPSFFARAHEKKKKTIMRPWERNRKVTTSHTFDDRKYLESEGVTRLLLENLGSSVPFFGLFPGSLALFVDQFFSFSVARDAKEERRSVQGLEG